MPYKDANAAREYHRQWRKLNSEKVKASASRNREKNQELLNAKAREKYRSDRDNGIPRKPVARKKEYAKTYYERNKDKINERCRRYRQANPEKQRERTKKWFDENKERKHELDKLWREKNKEVIDARRKSRQWSLKIEVWGHYGGRCACCGVDEKEFLTMDHINGGGAKHRKELRRSGSQHIYGWLKENNYPEGYRVLCMNCNFAHGMYGYCPHSQTKP